MEPKLFPILAIKNTDTELNPAIKKAMTTISEENGKTVAAKNVTRNSPRYPHEIKSICINKKVRLPMADGLSINL